MPTSDLAAVWTTDAPVAWPDVPAEMTVTTLVEIEACPRRWALGSAEYAGLWTGRGYPPRVQLGTLAGTVVHLVLEVITRELVRAGCSSVQDPVAPQVMRNLGGYSRILNDCIDRVLDRLGENPRASRLLEYTSRSLRAQVPELRARAQAMLCRMKLPHIAGGQSWGHRRMSRGPLTLGVFPELEFRATQISWKGKADLLVLSEDACEITDFKTGARDDGYQFQIRVYAMLWSRDNDLNPGRRLANRLIIRYGDGDLEIDAPTALELDDIEREVVARRDVAHQAASQLLPEARPDADRCRYCGVRQLCDTYWTTETQRVLGEQAPNQRFADFELIIIGRHGPSSWDAVVELSRGLPAGKRVLLRTNGDIQFCDNDRIRLLDAAVTVSEADNTQPVVITLGILSEVFAVSKCRSITNASPIIIQ